MDQNLQTNNAPLISVIIPVYNTKNYLNRCLDSVLGNTYRNLEVICVNDGSTDGSLAVLQEYAEADHRIKVVNKDNGGVAAARNAALNIAAGEYICFIDSDDCVHRRYFEVLMYFKNLYNADMVICGYTTEFKADENIDLETIKAKNLSFAEKLNGQVKVFVHGRIYSHELISEYRFDENLHTGEGISFNLTIFCQHKNTVVIIFETALYYYIYRKESLSHMVSAERNLQLADYFREKANDGPEFQYPCLVESIKRFLDFRYISSFFEKEKRKKYKIGDADEILDLI